MSLTFSLPLDLHFNLPLVFRQAINGPIGYKHLLSNSSILKLSDLDRPGLYVFNLTVTDSQNSTNSTTASITVSCGSRSSPSRSTFLTMQFRLQVLKEADYPPTANAGPDIVLYLPQNEVTLNGNQSTDDKVTIFGDHCETSTRLTIFFLGNRLLALESSCR